jgi:integrase
VPAETVEALRKRKAAAQADARARSEIWSDERPIFLGERGDLPDYRSLVRDHFNPILKRAGLRRLTPKAMRHGHVSALLERGMSMLAVAKRAGHASTAMIDRVYGHTGRAEDERAADEIAEARRTSIRLA